MPNWDSPDSQTVLEQSVAAANSKVEGYKSRIGGLENDFYSIRVARAGTQVEYENVRCFPWCLSKNSMSPAVEENRGRHKEGEC